MVLPFQTLPDSKLPLVGTTIFTIMSAEARKHGAINLSQGFPDFEPEPELVEALAKVITKPVHQYAPMAGMLRLREWIAAHHQHHYAADYDPESEVTITSGGTEALFAAITAFVRAGDEVICFDPSYDVYVPAVELQGGRAVRVPMRAPEYAFDWDAVEASLTPRTRLLLLNNPHNPTGRVFTEADLLALKALAARHPFLVVADEVYEHMVFDGRQHLSMTRDPELRARSLVIGSFGKNLHITGWKVGWCAAPEGLTLEFRKVHQYLTFSTATPLQEALVQYLEPRGAAALSGLNAFYQSKRDRLAELLSTSRLFRIPSQGSYFELYSYEQLSDQDDRTFCHQLVQQPGVAAIPISVFYANGQDQHIIRLCFAKSDDTLVRAAERLCSI
jgi:methionine aminotransferase